MKIFSKLLLCVFAIALTMCAAACSSGEWKLEIAPTCTEKGTEVKNGKTREIEALGHDWSEWEVVEEPTHEETGLKKRFCNKCGEIEEEAIPQLDYLYSIKVVDGGKIISIYYFNSEEYAIEAANKVGFQFIGYVDENNDDFAYSGVLTENVIIHPVWQILETTTFSELKQRIESGATEILIASDIVLTETIYVTGQTTIYSKDNHTISRAAGFKANLFVVGENNSGENAIIINGKPSSLTIETKNNATLIFDGNKTQVDNVYGTGFFICNSAVLTIKNGVTIQNFKKVNNDVNLSTYKISHFAQVGGAAIIVCDSATFNMYGGTICNNEVNTDETLTFEYGVEDTEIESEINYLQKLSSAGGAIYNNGTINIYGGKLCENVAARGAAIFNYKSLNIFEVEFSQNSASVYGGAIYLPQSQYANVIIGEQENATEGIKILFYQNTAIKSGGAIFGQTVNTVVIFGGAKFEKNSSEEGNGGAINGSCALTIRNTVFLNNSAASKGGAIYAYCQDNEKTERMVSIYNCSFQENSASKGGALTVSGENTELDKFTTAMVHDCLFDSNEAVLLNEQNGEGGAIYISRDSVLNLIDCNFNENTSVANGGAIYNSASTVNITDCVFASNTSSSQKGGAIAVHSGGLVEIDGITAQGNSAANGNGGALYLYGGNAIIGNSESDRENLFKENSAKGGGAIYACATNSNACVLTIKKIVLEKNIATSNGGALYVYTNAVATIEELNASENVASGTGSNGYGGVAYVSGAATLFINTLNADGNQANKGGVIYMTTTGTKVTILAGESKNNTASSTDDGYTIYSNSAKAILVIKGTDTKEFFKYEEYGIKGNSTIGEYVEESNQGNN